MTSLDAAAQADAAADTTSARPRTHRCPVPSSSSRATSRCSDAGTLHELLAAHHADGNAVTVLTTQVAEPTGYGRILREPGTGDVLGIVEEKDADDAQRAITEINSSIYVFDAGVLRGALGRLGRDNAQGEVYLTDVLAIAPHRRRPRPGAADGRPRCWSRASTTASSCRCCGRR
jgi:bifunctional UDP-N-acetylglucosamine pyrophosphorylase/glucosamine-1-phosphate N-acetyltransferase